ncbi:MAG: S8 family serine peptidase [Pseudomonadota bacterium]
MKKLVTASICGISLLLATAAGADVSKMDGYLRIASSSPETAKAMLGKSLDLTSAIPTIDCLLKSTDPDSTLHEIIIAGGEVGATIGQIMSVTIPLDNLETISNLDEVVYLEAAKPMTPKMNAARTYTGVASVQAGDGLSQAYNGQNVLVGVVDGSLDWHHADFQNTNSTTRICYMRRRNPTTNAVQECTNSTIDDSSCDIVQGGTLDSGHGTNVTGIAAGNNSTYTGVAPQSFIAFGFNSATNAETSDSTTFSFSTQVLENVAAIFSKADSLDLPAVINLSLGTSLGAHDNTSLLEEGLNSAVAGEQGRVIVNAAGNENVNYNAVSNDYGGIHAAIEVSSAQAQGWKAGIFNSYIANYGTPATVDVWLADTVACRDTTIEVMAYRKDEDYWNHPGNTNTNFARVKTTAINFTSDRTSLDNITNDNKAEVDVYTYTSDSQNGRPHAIVNIMPVTSWATDITNSTNGYNFDIIFRTPSGQCTGDMWLYPDQTAVLDFFQNINTFDIAGTDGYGVNDGDSNKTTTVPGTASEVITVGSYIDRATWTDINGTSHNQNQYDPSIGATGSTVGSVSLFSSLGPTGEISGARIKPDLVAPGEPIISSAARGMSFDSEILGDSTHAKFEGTSMASPHVAGIVALLLEKNNCLTATEVKNALTSTATNVPVNGATPNNYYGYGKVNALAAIQTINSSSACYGGSSCGSGGGSSSSSCGGILVPHVGPINYAPVLLVLLPFIGLIMRRIRK